MTDLDEDEREALMGCAGLLAAAAAGLLLAIFVGLAAGPAWGFGTLALCMALAAFRLLRACAKEERR